MTQENPPPRGRRENAKLMIAIALAAVMAALATANRCASPPYTKADYAPVILGDELKEILDAGDNTHGNADASQGEAF